MDRGDRGRDSGLARGDVHWVSFDRTVGGEIRKRRPAVIVSNDGSNRVLNRLQVVPMTSNVGRVYPAEAIVYVGGVAHKAMANQIQTVSKIRVGARMAQVSTLDMQAVERAIRLQLGLR